MIGEFVSKASVIKILKAALKACEGNTAINQYGAVVLKAVLDGIQKLPTFVIREDDDEYE